MPSALSAALAATDLREGDLSVQLLDPVAEDALLVEVERERVDAEDEPRHVLLVVDVRRLRQEYLPQNRVRNDFMKFYFDCFCLSMKTFFSIFFKFINVSIRSRGAAVAQR
jgi:hypothetical protein